MSLRWVNSAPKLLVAALLVLPVAGCATMLPGTSEHLDWNVAGYVLVFEEGTGWKGIRGNETTSRIYSTSGETVENWTVTLMVVEVPIAITLGSSTRWNPDSFVNAEKARLAKKGCTDAWTIIESDSTSLVYERTEVNCPGYLHQHEIGRLVMGDWYAWWLTYRIRNRALSGQERSALIGNLAKARVVE